MNLYALVGIAGCIALLALIGLVVMFLRVRRNSALISSLEFEVEELQEVRTGLEQLAETLASRPCSRVRRLPRVVTTN